MVSEPSSQKQNHLRRRMHILERAQSLSSLTSASSSNNAQESPISPKGDLGLPTDEPGEETAQSSLTDYETDSASSEEFGPRLTDAEISHSGTRPKPAPQINTSHLSHHNSSRSPVSPRTQAWYEFDLAVVVALVSPAGNWLTGGDHVKNFLLFILLIFYLHQIVEIPWSLYNDARPRRRAPHVPGATLEDRYRHLARTELRALEFFFLALTVISPFLGAALLRYVTSAVAGKDVVSWFSTGLFVLATGIRPWRHVIDRLHQRASDLHDVIHYPSPDPAGDDMPKQMDEMMKRVAQLEKALVKMRNKLADGTEEVYEYVDDAVDAVEKTIRRHERRCEKQEARVKVVEENVEVLRARNKGKSKAVYVDTQVSPPSIFSYFLPAWLVSPPRRNLYSSTYSPSSATSKHSLRSFPSSSSIRLETIPEEGSIKSATAAPSYPPAPRTSLVSRSLNLATLPLRAIIGQLVRSY